MNLKFILLSESVKAIYSNRHSGKGKIIAKIKRSLVTMSLDVVMG